MPEFNDGFITALVLCYAHRFDRLFLKDELRSSIGTFVIVDGAKDHLIDIEIPSDLDAKLKKKIEEFKKDLWVEVNAGRFGFTKSGDIDTVHPRDEYKIVQALFDRLYKIIKDVVPKEEWSEVSKIISYYESIGFIDKYSEKEREELSLKEEECQERLKEIDKKLYGYDVTINYG